MDRFDDDPEYVYMTFSSGGEIKIGRTWNIKLRMQNTQLRERTWLFLCGYIPMRHADAVDYEKKLHADLRPHLNRDREWFKASPEVLNFFYRQPGVTICLQKP